jgi:ribonuclease E
VARPRRRRRRGSRGGRGRSKSVSEQEAAAEQQPPGEVEEVPGAPPTVDAEGDAGPSARPRRRRSRRKPASRTGEAAEAVAATEAAAPDANKTAGRRQAAKPAARTATKPRAKPSAEPKPARRGGSRTASAGAEAAGPTRVRRPRTTTRRRREPVPVPARAQDKVMLITEREDRDQIAVLEDRMLVEHYITRVGARSMVGNIYLGRVQNVLPGMEAAFVDVGRGRNAVLYAGEVSYDEDIEGPPPRIEQVIKSGQALMVQVTKDPIGGKGPRLTQQVSLPGRYLVLVPNSQVFGISRRLPDNERRRLRMAIRKVRPPEHGVIVRTAAEGASAEDLASDLARLNVEWERIAKKAKKSKAPTLLYEEPELTVRVVRDLFTDEEFREMATDSPRVHEQVTSYLSEVAPDLVEKVRLHQGKLPLFEEYHVVEQIHKALERKVWLPSGGYIVIDRTEAMTVIDVNTGKHVGSKNLEETVVGTNLEAAEEIARQLRLRDIGGMILIDFIDMLLEQNKEKVIETLREALARDKTRSQVFDISPLGILEVTRKRVSAGLLESFSETCPTCGGRGILVTYEF